jgi:hypothetical protein
MKKTAIFALATLLLVGVGGNLWAYEGGTKAVAAAATPVTGEPQWSPISVVPGYEMSPGKLIEKYLHAIPEPTLGIEGLREEIPGRSLGTKELVLFQRGE